MAPSSLVAVPPPASTPKLTARDSQPSTPTTLNAVGGGTTTGESQGYGKRSRGAGFTGTRSEKRHASGGSTLHGVAVGMTTSATAAAGPDALGARRLQSLSSPTLASSAGSQQESRHYHRQRHHQIHHHHQHHHHHHHHHGQGRGISKSRRPSPPRAAATAVGSSSASATTTAGTSSTPPSPSSSSSSVATALRSFMSPSALSLWGPDPVPLPQRFARIKRNLIAGHEAGLEACWARLVHALRAEVEHIECLGAHLVPSVEFADLDDPAQTARFGRDLRRYGVGVVRKVLPRRAAESAVRDTVGYLDGRRARSPGAGAGAGAGATRFRAPRQDPTCFDCFWTPAQVRSRAHPNVLRAQHFMMSLWGDDGTDGRPATHHHLPITYVDRIRVHGGGLDASTSGSNPTNTPAPATPSSYAWPQPPSQQQQQQQQQQQHAPQPQFLAPQSADDWINALQSSAGIIAQVDNGSLERWEPDGYGRGGTYDRVFHGRWEEYDPWECASRVHSTTDLYNGYGACSIFRMFQGLLALTTIEPGMLRLLPSPKLATAYYLLRPFFSPRLPAPATRSGPEWEAYLAPSNWELQRDPDTIIHGAVPGHAQRITERWHPHLHLRSSLVTLPTLQPGDYIFWHPDLPYHISSNRGHGMGTPSSRAVDDVSMLVYIPAAPLTQTNALYLARQRKAFQRGHPGPDFDSSGRGVVAEEPDVRPGETEIADVGGLAGLRAMGLAPWEVASMAGPDSETEVVRLANLILFPE